MTRQMENQQPQNDRFKSALRKVINNPKNSKSAKTAAGRGMARRRNHTAWRPVILFNKRTIHRHRLKEDQPAGPNPIDDNFLERA